jgi:hypothetical protein
VTVVGTTEVGLSIRHQWQKHMFALHFNEAGNNCCLPHLPTTTGGCDHHPPLWALKLSMISDSPSVTLQSLFSHSSRLLSSTQADMYAAVVQASPECCTGKAET